MHILPHTYRDAGLIHDLSLVAVQDYEYLRYSNDRSVRDAFLGGDVQEPYLYYHDIDLSEVEERLEHVHVLASVASTYADEVVRRAYVPKLREVREKYEFLDAVRREDDRAVLDASVRLYGSPRKDLFHYALRPLKDRIYAVEDAFSKDEQVRVFLDILRVLVASAVDTSYPWDTIALPKPHIYEGEASLSAKEIKHVFEEAFMQYDIEAWCAVIDAPGERTTFNTNHELRVVYIPSDEDLKQRKYVLTKERVDALIAHEVGTHVVRRVRGEASPLALLGVGLAGYLRGEEGVATYMEQQVSGAHYFAGTLGYLCVGWAYGIDGTPRTFRQLYDVVYPYFVVSSLEQALLRKESVDIGLLLERTKRRAWARCVRTFRGTTGATAGACFTKDLVYLEGNISIWQLVTDNPVWKSRLCLGKYDPTNEEHVSIVQELGLW